jgi:hypothetical protein
MLHAHRVRTMPFSTRLFLCHFLIEKVEPTHEMTDAFRQSRSARLKLASVAILDPCIRLHCILYYIVHCGRVKLKPDWDEEGCALSRLSPALCMTIDLVSPLTPLSPQSSVNFGPPCWRTSLDHLGLVGPLWNIYISILFVHLVWYTHWLSSKVLSQIMRFGNLYVHTLQLQDIQ